MTLKFQWNPAKAQSNSSKHGVSFDEAATVFADPMLVETLDEAHSIEEVRYLAAGLSNKGRLLTVWYTQLVHTTRRSAAANWCKKATSDERRLYKYG